MRSVTFRNEEQKAKTVRKKVFPTVLKTLWKIYTEAEGLKLVNTVEQIVLAFKYKKLDVLFQETQRKSEETLELEQSLGDFLV